MWAAARWLAAWRVQRPHNRTCISVACAAVAKLGMPGWGGGWGVMCSLGLEVMSGPVVQSNVWVSPTGDEHNVT